MTWRRGNVDSKKLPPGVRKRANGYAIFYRDPAGRQVEEPVGSDLRSAQRKRRKRMAEVKAGTWQPLQWSRHTTLNAFANAWISARKSRVRSWRMDEQRLAKYIRPTFGDRRLPTITRREVEAWIDELKATLAAKTIKNVHSVLHGILRDAEADGLIDSNPAATLRRGVLPRPRKRGVRPLTSYEVGQFTGDPRIPSDHRALYALCSFGGMREGEACGRRWRDLAQGSPLPRMMVDSQYQDQPLKTARDEDTAERHVPVHPILADLLHDWQVHGWNERFGRHPKSEDFIVPDPRDLSRSQTQSQVSKHLRRDAKKVGLELEAGVGLHSMRRWFITTARENGADKDLLGRITHDARGDIQDLYLSPTWEPLCRQVLAIPQHLPVREDAGGNAGDDSSVAANGENDSSFWWRRRESNPSPRTIQSGVYARIP